MDELKYFKPAEVNTLADEDGVVHDKCGTDECCQKCDTAEGETNDNEVTNRPNIS